VLETKRGTGVRVDYRCVGATDGTRYVWAQEIDGTPFERILRSAELEIELQGEDSRTTIRLSSSERLRGLSRLGSPMLWRATRLRLDEALNGIERALT
jgi:hypothetical protein